MVSPRFAWFDFIEPWGASKHAGKKKKVFIVLALYLVPVVDVCTLLVDINIFTPAYPFSSRGGLSMASWNEPLAICSLKQASLSPNSIIPTSSRGMSILRIPPTGEKGNKQAKCVRLRVLPQNAQPPKLVVEKFYFHLGVRLQSAPSTYSAAKSMLSRCIAVVCTSLSRKMELQPPSKLP